MGTTPRCYLLPLAGKRIPSMKRCAGVLLAGVFALGSARICFGQATDERRPHVLTPDEIWEDTASRPVFEQTFTSDRPEQPRAQVYDSQAPAPRFNGRVPNAGHDGTDCWMMDFDLPAKGRAQAHFPLPESDAVGVYYSFLLKIETEPEFGPTDLALAINMGAHPFKHSVYRSVPLEERVVRTGEWMSRIGPIWKAHCGEVYDGWTRFEGDTSAYFGRRAAGRAFDGILLDLFNRSDQARRVRLYCDDIKVVRRDVRNSPEMKAVLGAPRPIIDYTREQILRARARAADLGEEAVPKWVSGKLASADQWLARDITVPRKQAGYPTKYTCKECKGFLRPDPPTGYTCSKCGKKHTGELYDKLLAYVRHRELGQAAHALGFAWQWTDDERYAQRAEAILLGYADAIPHFQLGHNWLGTCWLMEDTLRGYDYVYEWLSEASRTRIDNEFLKRIRRLYHYNHHYPEGYSRLWETCGWISILTKDVDWIQYLMFSSVGNREVLLRYGLTADMISLKGPAYHGDIIRALNRVGTTLENCGVRFFDDRVRPVYDVVFKQIFPDRSLTAFGHSNVGYPATIYGFDTAYRHYRDPRYLTFCSERFPAEARWFLDTETPRSGDRLRLPSTHLEALGLTMLRSQPGNETVLALNWGAPQRNDPTRLDFQLYGGGGHLIWSSGTTYYGNPLMDKWYQRSLSRNMIVVDQGTQTPAAGTCILLDTDGPVQVVATELRNAYPDTRIVRIAALFDSGEAALVDLFASPRARTVDWVCQLPGDVTPPVEFTAVDTPAGAENGYEVLKNVRRAVPSSAVPLILLHKDKQGERGVRISPAAATGTEFFLAESVTGYQNKPSTVCLMRRPGVSRAVYATLFQPFHGPAGPATGEIQVRDVRKADDAYHFAEVTVTFALPSGRHALSIREHSTADGGYRMAIDRR